MPMNDAATLGDIFITVTGGKNAIDINHISNMKDGAVLSNSGHFNVEIDIESLEKVSKSKKQVREFVHQYTLEDGRKIHLLGEGRLINLAAAEGHPSAVMDMSFANQALSAEYIYNHAQSLNNEVISVPRDIDNNVGLLKLNAMKVNIDHLTE